MKCLGFYLFIFCILISSNLFAQTPKQIEADLLKSFKNIDRYGDRVDEAKAADVRIEFAKKLRHYTENNTSTLNYPFHSLIKAHLNICGSADGLFRIYSWDTQNGGTMHFFENVFQYKVGEKTRSTLDTPRMEGDSRPFYDKLYTLKTGSKTYYLATTLGIGSTKDYSRSIQIFSIENGKLNDDARIIKTKTGLHSEINYEYDLALTDDKVTSIIHFDPKTKSIYVPVVLGKGKLTDNYIVYKFTGQYFERFKN